MPPPLPECRCAEARHPFEKCVACGCAGDALLEGRKFADIGEFKKLLLAHPEQIARCVTEKLVTYATGHPVGLGDLAAVKRILAETKQADYGLRSLVRALVASELFRSK